MNIFGEPWVTQELIDETLNCITETLEIDPEIDVSEIALDVEFFSRSLEIRNSVWRCNSCDLRRTCNRPVPFLGAKRNPDIVVLGEAPGRQEDYQNAAFVGDSGQLLRASARKVGVSIQDFVNTCCCRPPNNRTPELEEIKACSGNLDEQIKHLQPWLVLTFGNVPLLGATGNESLKVTRDHGILFKTKWPGVWGYSFYHPSYVLRKKGEREKLSSKTNLTQKEQWENKDAEMVLRRWCEDWEYLAQVVRLREQFGVSILSSFKDNLMTLEQVMLKSKEELPYNTEEGRITAAGNRTTYLQRMDDQQTLNVDEIPF